MLSIDRFSTRLMRAKLATQGYRGNLDGCFDGCLMGWATTRGDCAANIGLFAGQKLLSKTTANIFRDDLRAANCGNGYHGFSVPLTDALLSTLAQLGGKLSVHILDGRNPTIGLAKLTGADKPAANTVPPTTDLLKNHLFGDFQALAQLLANPQQQKFGLSTAVAKSLLADRPDNGLPAYVDYVRLRYKQDREFDIAGPADETDHFLHWYLAAYSPLRGGKRVPMSGRLIDHYNEPITIGGVRTSLTRAHWAFLMGVRPILHSMDFGNRDWVEWAMYWWAAHQVRALYCEDCLVPDDYIQTLGTAKPQFAGQDYPLSAFLMRLAKETPGLSGLDVTLRCDREKIVFSALTMAANRPDYLRYIPNECMALALSNTSNSPLYRFLRSLSGEAKFEATSAKLVDAFQALDASAQSRSQPTPKPALSGHAIPLQIIGPFEKASGLGQAARLSAKSLSGAGSTPNLFDFDLDNPAPEGFSVNPELSTLKPAKVNLLHLNAESVPLAFAYLPDVFSNAYNIGYFFWELDSPADCHALGLDLLDEIWVSSDYGVEIFQPHTDKPVVNVGMCVEEVGELDRAQARAYVTAKTGAKPGEFVFLTSFDSFSFIQRKNPLAAIQAFKDAFLKTQKVKLVIKTQNRTKIRDAAQAKVWDDFSLAVVNDRRITVIDETLDYADLLKLKKGCDCYVSLHRSEGWGFGMIEAMNLGLPVLCTGYSGNMEFCRPDTAWLVDYKLVSPKSDDYIFVRPGQKWAHPDVAHAAKLMRKIVNDPSKRRARASAARALVQNEFTPAAIGRRYQARLTEIGASLSHTKVGEAR